MVETLSAKLNDIMTQFGSINDLRKEQPAVFAQLQQLINQVHEDYNQAAHQRIAEKEANWRQIDDPKVQATVDNKVALYKKKFGNGPTQYSGVPAAHPQDSQALAWANDPANASDPRAKAILKANGG